MLAPPPRPVGPSIWRLPDPASIGDEDLVGFGGDLAPETLVDAYRRGIFPWPHEGTDLPWFSPDPRALLFADTVHVSRSLRARLRSCGWETTVDRAFGTVMAEGAVRPGSDGTWITDEMKAAYGRLHDLGWAHSVEVWGGDDGELVGGIYGVAVGRCFTGESMFHRRTDGSKVALVDLCDRWQKAGGAFVDVQLPTRHLERMGAVPYSRAEFLSMLADVRDAPARIVIDRRPVSRLAPAR
ncbi:MAG TPA: leucyl/phenylalanyl-tRNA--protein transferase [Acidimicrobiales bacterium]|nr:leucyl/phenylalanyl-tRNA--protein transferase [Acidimicrobiales bacterium]